MRAMLASLALIAAAPAAAASAPTYAVSDRIAGPDGGWDYAAVASAEHLLYVARSDSVTAVDLAGDRTARSLGRIARGHAIVPLPGGALLVTSGKDGSVRLLDSASGSETTRIAVGDNPDAAFYDASQQRAVVMNAKSGTVSVIDVAKGMVIRTITLKPALEFGVAGPGDLLFVNNEDANEIEVADLATGKVGAAIAMPGCEGPTGLAYDRAADRLISACANGKAAIVDVVRRRLAALIPIGRGPDAVILDSARHLAFIPCGRDGVLEVLSLASRRAVTRIATVKTEIGARTGALDPADGSIYLPTAGFVPSPVAGVRPAVLPGSFHILVVKPS